MQDEREREGKRQTDIQDEREADTYIQDERGETDRHVGREREGKETDRHTGREGGGDIHIGREGE